MKKLFMMMVIATMMVGAANAQDLSKRKVYCELIGSQKLLSLKVNVTVDFGQLQKLGSDHSLVDEETGKKLTFNSMVDAMNYMGTLGWEFETAYIVTAGSGTYVYHWLMSKYVEDQDDINDGIKTRRQYKEEMEE